MVVILISGRFRARKIAYRVVVFPQPVGPVLKIIPKGRLINVAIFCSMVSERPRSDKVKRRIFSLRIRKAIFSPLMVGAIDTRLSYGMPSILKRILPS